MDLDKNNKGEPIIFYGAGLSFQDGCRLLLKWRHSKDESERKNVEMLIWHNQQFWKKIKWKLNKK